MSTEAFRTSSSGSFGLSAMQHSISLADTKAGALLAASIALTLSTFLALSDAASPAPACSLTSVLLLGAMVSFIGAGGCAFWTVRPRARVEVGGSIFYFRSTALAGTSAANPPDIGVLDESKLLDLQLRHIAELGKIAREKFDSLNPGLWLFAFGVVAYLVGQALRLLF